MSAQTTEPTATPLTLVFGSNAKVRMLSYLANASEPKRQIEIATEIGVSEATVSRAKRDLLESDFLEETGDGLVCSEDVGGTITTLESQL